MPRGKEYCQFEPGYFDVKEFKVVDDTRLHNVDPLHRTDGIIVEIVNGKVVKAESAQVHIEPPDAEPPP